MQGAFASLKHPRPLCALVEPSGGAKANDIGHATGQVHDLLAADT